MFRYSQNFSVYFVVYVYVLLVGQCLTHSLLWHLFFIIIYNVECMWKVFTALHLFYSLYSLFQNLHIIDHNDKQKKIWLKILKMYLKKHVACKYSTLWMLSKLYCI